MTARLERAAARIGQLFCAVRGHDSVLHFEGSRMLMRCTSCGHDSPGWETTTGTVPRQRFEGDRRRHAIVPLRIIGRRRA